MGVGMCPFVAIIFLLFPTDYGTVLESTVIGGYCLLYGGSLSSLVAITYDRYLLIHPPTYHSRMTRRKARIIIALGWGIPLTIPWFVLLNRETYLLICSSSTVLVSTDGCLLSFDYQEDIETS